MKKEDIPQNSGIYDKWKVVNYATGNQGELEPVLSAGWDVTNLANDLFHEKISHELQAVCQRIHAGELSPLAYHMTAAKMTSDLLSEYAEIPKRRVKHHLESEGWNKLDQKSRQRYADLFEITPEQLNQIPEAGTKE